MYLVKIEENGTEKYLFNRKVLISSPSMAMHFQTPGRAKEYVASSRFKNRAYRLELSHRDQHLYDYDY